MSTTKKGTRQMSLMVPEDLIDQIDLILADPRTGRKKHAAFSTVTINLWRQLLAFIDKPGVDPKKVLETYGVTFND